MKAKSVVAKSNDDALRERVTELAKAKGIRIAVSSRGTNPTVYIWADGSKSAHYADFVRYKQDMQSGRADRLRSFNGPPPKDKPLTAWDAVELKAWLHEHDR